MPAFETSEPELSCDSALLREYAADGSRPAFAEIVRRNRGLVFATALRITGEHSMAEEAAQNVFAILARKALSVARYDQPGAWLHHTAVYEAKKRLRSEIRHRRKLAALEASSDIMNAPATTDTALHDFLPHVDECIQCLRPAEQDAIRMRYLEDRSHAEIAAVLGKSEEAGKKHTARAMERLCTLLRRRGVVSAAALTASLQAGSRTASAISAESLATTALRSAATLTRGQLLFHTLQLMTTKQTTAAAAVLLLTCSTPVLWQERAIARARSDLAAASVPPPAPPETSVNAMTPEQNARVIALLQRLREPGAGAIDLQAAVAVAAKRDMGFGGEMPRYQRMEKLSAGELHNLFTQAAALPDGDRERTQLLLISLLAAKDPQAALLTALPLCRTVGEDFYDASSNTILSEIANLYGLWMQKDWRAALASYEKLRAENAFAGRGIRQDGDSLAASITALCYAHSRENALRLFATLGWVGRVNSLQKFALAARPEDRAFVLAEADRVDAEMPNHSYRATVISLLARGTAVAHGPEAGITLLNEIKVTGDQRHRALGAILETQLKGPLHEGCMAVLAWARANLPPEEAIQAGAQFLGNTGDQKTRNKTFRAFDWGDQRDAAIATMLTSRTYSNEPAEAVALAREITDHALKVQTLLKIAANTPPPRRGPAFLLQINSDTSLRPEERTTILNAPSNR